MAPSIGQTTGVVPTSKRIDGIRPRVLPELKKTLSKNGLTVGAPVFIRVFKESKELELWLQNSKKAWTLFKTYPVATWGSGTLGPKQKEGDGQAPEGFYSVGPKQMNPNSNYHLAFNVGYPNAFDLAGGGTGSAIMIHGSDVSIGCFAMTDPAIEEIYILAEAALNAGQGRFQAHLFPFRLTDERLAKEKSNTWHAFWTNLKEGYDQFEKTKIPPSPSVGGKKYQFKSGGR